MLLTGNSPAFANVLAEPGTRDREGATGRAAASREVTHQLGYLERLYPNSIGEACFIDADGEEFARAVRGEIAQPGDLSTVEEQTVFFAPTFALAFGQVHQTRPYVSPDTEGMGRRQRDADPAGRRPQARVRALRGDGGELPPRDGGQQAVDAGNDYELRVIDGRTGEVVIDGAHPQRVGAPLGAPRDARFASLARRGRVGRRDRDGRPPDRVPPHQRRPRATPTTGSSSPAPTAPDRQLPRRASGRLPIAMLAVALVIIALAGISLRASRRELESQANSDGLTGLGNRRKLLADLDRRVAHGHRRSARGADDVRPQRVQELQRQLRPPRRRRAAAAPRRRARARPSAPFGGRAYRPGGDEFCVIADAAHRHALEEAACHALSEHGEGFAISTAFGSVVIPQDTGDATEALRKADQAMYAQKHSGRATAGRQSTDVLMRALAERHPDLGDHHDGVAELVEDVGHAARHRRRGARAPAHAPHRCTTSARSRSRTRSSTSPGP